MVGACCCAPPFSYLHHCAPPFSCGCFLASLSSLFSLFNHIYTSQFGTMVHLAQVKRDSDVEKTAQQVGSIQLDSAEDDAFYSSVYGTRFATEQLPSTEMPEREMPREVAYRMIKDELSLDGNPMLK